MFFFGHIGITTGVVQNIKKRKVDLRAAAVMSLLPDLIDKPVGILYRNVLGNHTRLWGHSLLFLVLVLGWLLFFRRSRYEAWILWACCLGHLLLDRIWIHDLNALFWPFMGMREPMPKTILENWWWAIQQPWTIFGEVLGLILIVRLVVRFKLYKTAPRREFLSHRTSDVTQ